MSENSEHSENSENNELDNDYKEVSEDEYEEFLNEIYPEVEIGELTFYPGQIIKNLDPIAFRCGLIDYEDSLNNE